MNPLNPLQGESLVRGTWIFPVRDLKVVAIICSFDGRSLRAPDLAGSHGFGKTIELFEVTEQLAVIISQTRRARELDQGAGQKTAPEGKCDGDGYANKLSHGHTWHYP